MRPSGGRRHGHFDALRLSELEDWLRQQPDATLEALRAKVADQMALRCSLMAICRAVKKLGWSLKKRCGPANAIAPTCSAIAQTFSSPVGSQGRKTSCFSKIRNANQLDATVRPGSDWPALLLRRTAKSLPDYDVAQRQPANSHLFDARERSFLLMKATQIRLMR